MTDVKVLQQSVFPCKELWSLKHEAVAPSMVYMVLWRNMHRIKPGTPGLTPSLFKKCTGSFACITQYTKTTDLHPIQKDAAIMVKFLA